MKIHTIAGLTLGALSAFSVVAHAGDIPTVTVKFGDLDLNRAEGAVALYQRLVHAARSACESLDEGSLRLTPVYRACLDKAVSDAVAKINRPLVSEYAATKGVVPSLKLAVR